MGVSLFTSRVILRALGDVDFGLFNVVGGIIAIFSFVSDSMAGTSSRYITVALGGGDKAELRCVVSTTRLIQILLAVIIFILAETLGLWLLLNKLVIPAERMTAAFWVYQCSVATSMVLILSAPYNALIIAHEQMKAFAYISIFEAVSRLSLYNGQLGINLLFMQRFYYSCSLLSDCVIQCIVAGTSLKVEPR